LLRLLRATTDDYRYGGSLMRPAQVKDLTLDVGEFHEQLVCC
jgi:hypothetical protein